MPCLFLDCLRRQRRYKLMVPLRSEQHPQLQCQTLGHGKHVLLCGSNQQLISGWLQSGFVFWSSTTHKVCSPPSRSFPIFISMQNQNRRSHNTRIRQSVSYNISVSTQIHSDCVTGQVLDSPSKFCVPWFLLMIYRQKDRIGNLGYWLDINVLIVPLQW